MAPAAVSRVEERRGGAVSENSLINRNPMATDLWLDRVATRIERDHIGFPQRHVAIYAEAENLSAHGQIFSATLHPVAGKAALRKIRQVTLLCVDIVAGGACHTARAIAAAALEEL